MRLLFFIYSLSAGGAERVMSTLANYWVAKNWRVTVVTVAGRNCDFYVLDRRIRRIALGLDRQSNNAAEGLVNNLRRIHGLRRILQQEKPDVAVSMMATANSILALASWGVDVRAIASERIHPPTLPLGRTWENIRRWSYPRLFALVAQTDQSAAWLSGHARVPHIEVIPNPVNYPIAVQEPKLAPTKTLKALGYSRVLLAVGRLEQQKGFDRLIQAFACVCLNYPGWVLVILGEGSLRKKLEQQAARLNVAGRVCLPGAVGNVSEWFETADLYALSSRFEGFPNTLLESLAYGVPSVAVDCDTGPREIIRHEVDGLLVPQDDQKALVAALDRLMGNDATRARFAERAVEARERFAIDRIASQWEALFARV